MYAFPPSVYATMLANVSPLSFLTSARISTQFLYSPELSQFLWGVLRGRQHATLTGLLTQPETILLERQISVVFLRRYFQESGFLCVPNVLLRSFTSWSCTFLLEPLELFGVLEGGGGCLGCGFVL